jgi:RNA polymerase sigma-70 factor (ECF subfamily)
LYTNSTIDFKDLYQDIVLQLWKSYPNFKSKSKLSTWIYQVSLNTALYKRRLENSRLHLDTLAQFHYDIPEITDSDKKENIERVKELLSALTDIEKALITLYLDEYSYDEISEIMGITQTNVATKINRIKQKLRMRFNN